MRRLGPVSKGRIPGPVHTAADDHFARVSLACALTWGFPRGCGHQQVTGPACVWCAQRPPSGAGGQQAAARPQPTGSGESQALVACGTTTAHPTTPPCTDVSPSRTSKKLWLRIKRSVASILPTRLLGRCKASRRAGLQASSNPAEKTTHPKSQGWWQTPRSHSP